MNRSAIAVAVRSQTVDMSTGAATDGAATMMLMPARPDTCELCATAHEPAMPHNAGSLFYQMRFHAERGRYPDWRDAMTHCAADVSARFTAALVEAGVDVEGGALRPGQGSAR